MQSASPMTRTRTISRGLTPNDRCRHYEVNLATAYNHPEPIASDVRVNATLGTQPAECLMNWPRMSGDDFAAAVSEIGDSDPLGLAPIKLYADRAMADRSAPVPTNDWPSDARAIVHVQIYAAQRAAPIAESDHVGNIEEADAICRDAISDGRRANGVFDRERLKADAGEGNRFLQWH
jgi:hypothetical protein